MSFQEGSLGVPPNLLPTGPSTLSSCGFMGGGGLGEGNSRASRFWPVAPAKISHTHKLHDMTVAMQLRYIFLSALRSKLSLSLLPGRSELPQGPGFCSMRLKIWYHKAWSCSDRVPLLDPSSIARGQSLIMFWYH